MKGQLATFAAGCFWGVEEIFRRTGKIISCRVGYTGGIVDNPNYRMVCSGETGHAEAIEIEYDPKQTRYEDLLAIFWANHNPTTLNRQVSKNIFPMF
jgi:peptide-methionine (S)-S-oxide reductase